MKIGSTLKSLRENLNMSQVELCAKTGLSQTTICQLEKDDRWPTPATLKSIADALKTKPFVILAMSVTVNDVPTQLSKTTLDFKNICSIFTYGRKH